MRETEEQADLRAVVRRFLAERADLTRVRTLMAGDGTVDQTVWKEITRGLGLVGLAVPELWGGAGRGLAEETVVLEEAGRALYGGPYLAASVLAPALLLEVGDEAACAAHLPAILAGDTLAVPVVTSGTGEWSAGGGDLTARADGTGGWTLGGVASHVVDASAADLLLVVAGTTDGPALFAVPTMGPGVTVTPQPGLDQTRGLARVELREAAGTRIGGRRVDTAVRELRDRAWVAVAAEQLGVASRCLELSVDYATTRQQFGGPIGRFQAVKHLCADMYLTVEAARSVVLYAERAIDELLPERTVGAAMARVWCSDAACRVAADTVQVHGGIGFTWESDVHLYFKRAEASALLFGDPDDAAEIVAAARLEETR
ncbi:hypothetical protein AD006_32010 (plasmid) [Pseudonocardia sp. EC080610-09]|nr:hypothetical protein AD006_32010 [Pseudonocardia sp. EC080610-09]ALL85698.1 hypothetical protein AD017_28540 [Pseudonocardia sp. EC080619-01]